MFGEKESILVRLRHAEETLANLRSYIDGMRKGQRYDENVHRAMWMHSAKALSNLKEISAELTAIAHEIKR